MTFRNAFKISAGAAVIAAMASCGKGGPPPARPGTPPFYMLSAKDYFEKGDYAKASEQLAKVTQSSDSELASQAWPWKLVLQAGWINAYRELADNYETGARASKASQTPFRKKVADYRTMGGRLALQFAQDWAAFQKGQPQGEVSISFSYPRGSLVVPQPVSRILDGRTFTDSEAETTFAQMVQRAVLVEVCSVMGAPGDGAKAQAALKSVPVKVPRAQFELAMAKALYSASTLFGPTKGAHAGRQEFICQQALKAVEMAGDGKEAKDLKDRIQRDLKDAERRKV